jgi:hypothetical protein
VTANFERNELAIEEAEVPQSLIGAGRGEERREEGGGGRKKIKTYK